MKPKQVVTLTLLMLVGIAAVAGAALAYYWNRATALPTWYTSSRAETTLAESLDRSGSSLLQTKLATGDGVRFSDGNRVEISLSETELTQLITAGLAQSPQTANFLQATQGINASIEGDQLSGGVVVNPANLPLQDLSPQGQQAVEQVLNRLPGVGDRSLYIGIEGSPRIDNGRLVLGEDTRLQVGNVQLSIAEVSRLTGLSPEQLTEKINLVLPQAGLTLDGIEFVDGEAVLRGVQP